MSVKQVRNIHLVRLFINQNQNIMSVKPEIFQQTRQTILKNKYQFIQIQLVEVHKRICALKAQNNKLKSQIKQHKCKPSKAASNAETPALTSRQQLVQLNKQNKSINKNTVQDMHTHRININSLVANRRKDTYKVDMNAAENQVKLLEQKLKEEGRVKEQKLLCLESQIKVLKEVWNNKQQSINYGNANNYHAKCTQQQSFNQSFNQSCGQNKEVSFVQADLTTQQTKRANGKMNTSKPQQLHISIESLNQSKIDPNQNEHSKFSLNNSLNSSIMNESHQGSGVKGSSEARRKTMSVNLSNNNLMTGFNFGKKSMKKPKIMPQANYQRVSLNSDSEQIQPMRQKQRRISSASFSLANNQMQSNQMSRNSNSSILNNSLTHSNSRSSMSTQSFLNGSLNGSKSQLKRSEASKSYAKIVTKLQCMGCRVQYRPNQFYTHIEQCREYMKLKLMQEKEMIDNEIMNISMPHF